MPTLRDAACSEIVRSPITSTSPNGITAKATMAGTTASTGASQCNTRSAPAIRTSSLSRNFIGSATRVFTAPSAATPKMAARFAPIRSCMRALPLRSKKSPAAITCSMRIRMKAASATAITTSISMGSFVRQPVDERLRPRDVEVLVVLLVVHLHDGRRPAGSQALDLLQLEAAVGRPLAVGDPEPLLDGAEDLLGAAQRAREVAADLDAMARRLRLPVRRVEGRHRRHPRERQLHQLRDVGHHRLREPAELALREPERRHERRAPLRVTCEDLPVLAERGRGEPRAIGHTRPRSC